MIPNEFEWSISWLIKTAKTDFDPTKNSEHYITVMMLYTLYFIILNSLVHFVCLWKNKTYIQFDTKKRAEYRAKIISIAYATMSILLSSLGI